MTNKERDEILLEIKSSMADMQAKITDLQTTTADLQTTTADLQTTTTDLQTTTTDLQTSITGLKTSVADMQQEIRSISRSVAKIEVEHGGKIQLILDVLCGHINKLDEHEVRFKSNEKILENHDLRLDILEEKASNL